MRNLCCLALFSLLVMSGCGFLGAFAAAVRPFQASALKGQNPAPASEKTRQHFVIQEDLLRDVTYLSAPDCEGRATGTKGNALAREYIKKRMNDAGLAVQEQRFVYSGEKAGVNVIGTLPGTDPNAPWIVISAHYDHLGYSKREHTFYPGADDNAAGVAALFALAKYFSAHPSRHPLLFAAFDAEELGLIGSHYFLQENTVVPKEYICFNLNLDMISRSKKR